MQDESVSSAEIDDPQGDILQAIGAVTALAILAVMAALGAGLGQDFLSDARAAEVTHSLVTEADARKEVRPEDRFPLRRPLECDFTMRQSVAGVVVRETCWTRKEQVWL